LPFERLELAIAGDKFRILKLCYKAFSARPWHFRAFSIASLAILDLYSGIIEEQSAVKKL
jgi:hypothetical protein